MIHDIMPGLPQIHTQIFKIFLFSHNQYAQHFDLFDHRTIVSGETSNQTRKKRTCVKEVSLNDIKLHSSRT